jgi:hypothetical protein
MFPIKHGDVFNETFSGTHKNSGYTYDRTGTIKIEGDGYGTLILPFATVKNCLRVKVTTTYGDKLSGSTVADYIDEGYYWYHPDLNVVLLKHHNLKVVGAPNGTKTGEYADKSLVGIDHPDFEYHEISVYPQPASNVLNINYDLSQSTDVRIRLSDIAGRTVQPELILNNQQTVKESIDISALQAGVYVVQMVLNNSQVLTRKIIVQ